VMVTNYLQNAFGVVKSDSVGISVATEIIFVHVLDLQRIKLGWII